MSKIFPVILSGGAGTRLWPESRQAFPKQLLPLISEKTMIQETGLRLTTEHGFEPPIIISNEEHRFSIRHQLADIDVDVTSHILEPVGRHTAAAVITAALDAEKRDPDSVICILSADHNIEDVADFIASIKLALPCVRQGALATFGIKPETPDTGFGYIRAGAELADTPGIFEIDEFVEKPDLATAESFLASGNYFWNGGIFLFGVRHLIAECGKLCPDILSSCRLAYDRSELDLDFIRLDKEAFEKVPSVPIDVAVMEKTKNAVTIPVDFGWNDVGSWKAMWEMGDKDADGNVASENTLIIDTKNSLVRSKDRLVVTLGLDNIIAVDTGDVVMISSFDAIKDIKKIIAGLESEGRTEHILHNRVHRPWGYYESLDNGSRHQVKHICVNPGSNLSLQYHHKRAEHWVVVAGEAEVIVGDEEMTLRENQSVYIPVEAKHRLSNTGDEPLHLIEVQTGAYLGEDDIVRLEDVYGRIEGQ